MGINRKPLILSMLPLISADKILSQSPTGFVIFRMNSLSGLISLFMYDVLVFSSLLHSLLVGWKALMGATRAVASQAGIGQFTFHGTATTGSVPYLITHSCIDGRVIDLLPHSYVVQSN